MMSAWQSQRLSEIEAEKARLEEELTATKIALLGKERQCIDQLSKIAELEGRLRRQGSAFSREDVLNAIDVLAKTVTVTIESDVGLRWNCAFAFIGAAITHESTVHQLIEKVNDALVKAEASVMNERKLRSEAAAQLSGLHDTVDSLTFELNRVKRDRDEAVARSQRQAARITDMELTIENLRKELLSKNKSHDEEVARIVNSIHKIKKFIEENL